MASSTVGSKESTSTKPKGKPDPAEAVRKVRVVQLVAMQGLFGALLGGLAFLSRGDVRTMALCLWTLVVPACFAYVYWTAYRRHERALADRTWTKDWAKAQDRRNYSALGGVFVAWIAGVLGILAFL